MVNKDEVNGSPRRGKLVKNTSNGELFEVHYVDVVQVKRGNDDESNLKPEFKSEKNGRDNDVKMWV